MTRSNNIFLEDIDIEGFKSFSEPTNMTFQPGIGVIIGNNGVGKSNILDAIVWVLGENDLERLRCHGQEELFFSGSKKYPPASRIRVELNFKKGRERKAPVTKVVREMTKKGRDSYWIDGVTCQRNKYRDWLENLGLKHSLRTIIRQEQINDMMLLSPQQRFNWVGSLLGASLDGNLSKLLQRNINSLFHDYLALLIPEWKGRLQLLRQNGQDGLEVKVALSGKRIRKAHQLSGGEKSVTSLALKLAIFEQLESPFYLLDEVEPSLDYTNHKSMQTFLKTMASNKQLMMITHLRSTIQLANTVYGVRTRPDGSSFMKFYFVMNERLLRLYKCC